MVMLDNHNMSNGDTQTREQKRLGKVLVGVLKEIGLEIVTDIDKIEKALLDSDIQYHAKLSALGKAARYIREWLFKGGKDKKFIIELPQSTQRKVKQVMGQDFDSHYITANSIVHAKKNHGLKGIKLSSSSIPLRDEDFELMPYIMTAPDQVSRGSIDGNGRESVRFYKTLSNGYVVVAEKELKNSPNDMETITMWAEKSSSNVSDARTIVRPLNSTSQPASVARKETDARTVIISTEDAAKIRKDAEIAIAKEQILQKLTTINKITNTDGEVYGFTVNGKIYLDPEKLNANTPIHEYTHLWDNALMKANPELWQRGKDLMKQLPMWEEVKHDPAYKTIADNEDLIASEVHSRLAGNHGELYLTSMLGNNRVRGDFFLLVKIRQWLRDAMKFIRDAFTNKWSNKDLHSLTLEEFSKMPLKSLADGFNPTKIATSNVLQARFIGERGAANLDKTNGDTVMMDTLAEAKRMESENEDAKTIKIATGWEKGVDNKWRYEQKDGRINLNVENELYEEGRTDWTLEEFWYSPKLYQAYPELKDLPLRIDANATHDLNAVAYYDPDEREIVLSDAVMYYKDESSVAHEIQHAIQYIEGFARGGNSKMADVQQAYRDKEVAFVESKITETNNVLLKIDGKISKLQDQWTEDNAEATEKTISILEEECQQFIEHRNTLEKTKARILSGDKSRFGKVGYDCLAGEVEARNVQSRMKMPDDERRNTLATETEDLTRDYQVILKSSPRLVNMSEDEFMAVRERARVEAYIYRHEHPKVTISDYHKSTVATFKGVETKDVEHLWSKMKASGKYRSYQSSLSDSEYLIGRHGDIYRKSDHWGKVSSCNWDLKWDNPHHGNITEIGKCNIKDFRPKMLANWEIGYLKAKMEREQRSLPKSITIERGKDGYVVRGEDAQTLSRLLQKHCSQGEAVSSSLLSIPSEDFVETIGKLKEYGVNPVLKISKENIKLDIDEDRDEDVHHAFHR